MHSFQQLHAISLLCRRTLEEVEQLNGRFDALDEWLQTDYDDDEEDSQASVYEGEFELMSEDSTESASEEVEEGEITYADACTDTDDLQVDASALEQALLKVELMELEDQLVNQRARLCELLAQLQRAHQERQHREHLVIASEQHLSRKVPRKA